MEGSDSEVGPLGGAPDMTELAQAATSLHEMYLSLQEAGFTKSEALNLVARAMIGRPE